MSGQPIDLVLIAKTPNTTQLGKVEKNKGNFQRSDENSVASAFY
jgi:hypothetical protein